ncbi:TPA: hypothetical protein ACOEME_004704, partial [Enterobacter cloacae subsp. dissolvens]
MKHTPLKKSAVALAVMTSLFAQAVVAEETTIDKPNTTLTGQKWTDKVTIEEEALGKDSVVTIKDSVVDSVEAGKNGLTATMGGGTLNIQGLKASVLGSGDYNLLVKGDGGSVNISDSAFGQNVYLSGAGVNINLSNVFIQALYTAESAIITGNNVTAGSASAFSTAKLTLDNSFVGGSEDASILARDSSTTLTLNNSRIEAALSAS